MGPSSLILLIAAPLAGQMGPSQSAGVPSPWCCELQRSGHIASSDEEVLRERYRGWTPEALAGRLWSLSLHRCHQEARFHDAAHRVGRYEISAAPDDAESRASAWRPGEPSRVVRGASGQFEHRLSWLTDIEQAELKVGSIERAWLSARLSDCRLEWEVQLARLPKLPQSTDELEALLCATPVEVVAGWYWVLEASASATWRRYVELELQSGDFHIVDAPLESFCGNTHDLETPGQLSVRLANGRVQHRRTRTTGQEHEAVRALLRDFFRIDDHLGRLQIEHHRVVYGRGCGPRLSLCFPQPPRDCSFGVPVYER